MSEKNVLQGIFYQKTSSSQHQFRKEHRGALTRLVLSSRTRVILQKKRRLPMNIHEIIKKLVAQERSNTHQILLKLNELYEGRYYAELGYSSLFDYCTRELKYSSDQACRRISAAKLLRSEPSLTTAIENGDLTITHLAKAQTLFNQMEVAQDIKLDLLKRLENSSNFEAEKMICEINPKKSIVQDLNKIRPIEKNLNEIKIFVDDDLLLKLKMIKERARKDNWSEAIKFLCTEYLDKSEQSSTVKGVCKERPAKNSRYIPLGVKQQILKRANHQCEFIGINGVRCNSHYKLEYAHIIPYAHGGENGLKNLSLFCKSHNQHDAIKMMGPKKMAPYLNRHSP
jgi:hypothetical protein